MDRLFWASFRLVRLGWRWSVGFPFRVMALELCYAGVACDTVVWWGDGSIEPTREGLAALSRGSSAVIWNQDGDQVFYDARQGRHKELFWGEPVSRKCPWQAVYESARDALIYLHAARDLKALRAVPGYRLELLGSHGKKQNKRLAGFYSIRINNRWRLVFRWTEQNAVSVQVGLTT